MEDMETHGGRRVRGVGLMSGFDLSLKCPLSSFCLARRHGDWPTLGTWRFVLFQVRRSSRALPVCVCFVSLVSSSKLDRRGFLRPLL